MINIVEKKDCVGCLACSLICKKKCISFKNDEEGFLYPIVDTVNCNNCGLCERICPVINQNEIRRPLFVYAAKNRNETVRMNSSSGGIFSLLAEFVLSQNGIVFGARFDENWKVVHNYTKYTEGISYFRGSKYVQSNLGDSFLKVKSFLDKNKLVLFSGTPCQIAALLNFIQKKYDNLITVDIICHGVSSPLIWDIYKEKKLKNELSKLNIKSIVGKFPIYTNINFRNKSEGWRNCKFTATIKLNNQKYFSISESYSMNSFLLGFSRNLYLRPSCHFCPTKSLKSGSDITIADFWGIENVLPKFNDNLGISSVMINTLKGIIFFKNIDCEHIECTYNDVLMNNPCLENSTLLPQKRSLFFKHIQNVQSFDSLINQLVSLSIYYRIKCKIFKLIKYIFRY